MREELLAMALRWREKAERIELQFRTQSPVQAELAEAAIKTCAEELELFVSKEVTG